MKQIYPDLWQTRAEHPFFGVTSHAYLLSRDTGNVLLYSTGLPEEYEHIQKLGGITHQYLSHSDEAGPALAEIKKQFVSSFVATGSTNRPSARLYPLTASSTRGKQCRATSRSYPRRVTPAAAFASWPAQRRERNISSRETACFSLRRMGHTRQFGRLQVGSQKECHAFARRQT